HTGKRVRTEAKLAEMPESVAASAVDLAERELGSLEGKRALLFGAGRMSELAARDLRGRGAEVVVSSRTLESAQELVDRIGGRAARRALGAGAQGRRDADLADREQAPARADGPREGGRLRAAARALRTARRRRVSTADLYARALKVIPGGVNSPVRAMKAVGLDVPLFARRGEGAYLEDVDGRRYIDWVLSWGPLIFGHADPETVEAVIEAARDGTTFGTATEREVELAEEIVRAVPSVEMVRLVSSGTEAAMTVLRLARAVSGREPFVRVAGGYHGHADPVLSEAGSGVKTPGIEAGGEGRGVEYTELEAGGLAIGGGASRFSA